MNDRSIFRVGNYLVENLPLMATGLQDVDWATSLDDFAFLDNPVALKTPVAFVSFEGETSLGRTKGGLQTEQYWAVSVVVQDKKTQTSKKTGFDRAEAVIDDIKIGVLTIEEQLNGIGGVEFEKTTASYFKRGFAVFTLLFSVKSVMPLKK